MGEYSTIEQASRALNVSRMTLYRWRKEGRIKSVNLHGRLLFDISKKKVNENKARAVLRKILLNYGYKAVSIGKVAKVLEIPRRRLIKYVTFLEKTGYGIERKRSKVCIPFIPPYLEEVDAILPIEPEDLKESKLDIGHFPEPSALREEFGKEPVELKKVFQELLTDRITGRPIVGEGKDMRMRYCRDWNEETIIGFLKDLERSGYVKMNFTDEHPFFLTSIQFLGFGED